MTWKVKNAVNEFEDWAKEISRQNVEDETWLLFTAYGKIGEKETEGSIIKYKRARNYYV